MPPKKDKKSGPLPEAPAAAAPAETFDMVFHCQLAHGSSTRQVRDFTNVKQLYESIAKAFGIGTQEIIYCTLNTHKIDMSRLLGGQIGLDDFLFAHVRGESKVMKVNKDGPALGLTISDNGAGYAFIKKIREDSIMAKVQNCAVGDHITEINGTDMVGCRHFEVARMLKEIPPGSQFTMKVVEPKKAFEAIAPRGNLAAPAQDLKAGAGRKTLRMKKDGTAVIEEEATGDVAIGINKVEDMLDAMVGIRDHELSATIYQLAVAAKEPDAFATKLDEQLADFEFPDEFILDVFELCKKK